MPSKKTFKEQKEVKEQHDLWKANREGKKQGKQKGGHTNLLREALEEEAQEDE